MSEVYDKAVRAKAAARQMSLLTTDQKNQALLVMAEALDTHQDEILQANAMDLRTGQSEGLSKALLDRLALNPQRIAAIAQGLQHMVTLTDPIGEQLNDITRPNGLHIIQLRVPIGVIGIIYEARPNVTVDAAGLCLKTGNAVILRGGSAALHTNQRVVEILRECLQHTEVPVDAIQLIYSKDRVSVDEMMKSKGYIDVLIPRGGHELIQRVVQNATIPVIETGAGVCHTYIDESAQLDMAIAIALNAKVQRPSVCNAMETLLVHERFAEQHLLLLAERFTEAGVALRGDVHARSYVPSMHVAQEIDWDTEYGDYILNVKVVRDLHEALIHIQAHSTMHSECIITENATHAQRFLQEVDAAAVYHNASTRFTDGFEFGYGAEIGISTQKLHARGPMGLPALTSTKYIITGNGQIRQ